MENIAETTTKKKSLEVTKKFPNEQILILQDWDLVRYFDKIFSTQWWKTIKYSHLAKYLLYKMVTNEKQGGLHW